MTPELPTDLKLLQMIYDEYYEIFVDYDPEAKSRSTKVWVPINVEGLALLLDTDDELIYGRMYYHLNQKYGEAQADGSRLDFFQPRVGRDPHCVNFPYLASVLADLREDHRRFRVATGVAAVSLFISVISLAVALFA